MANNQSSLTGARPIEPSAHSRAAEFAKAQMLGVGEAVDRYHAGALDAFDVD
jgi:hypothetical protein